MKPEVDLSVLSDSCGGNMMIIGTALRLFVTTTRTDLQRLAEFVASQDAQATGDSAHRIKGAARVIGGTRVVAHSQAIEDAAETTDWRTIKAELPLLNDAFHAIDAHIARYFPG
jgi:HPt (histidine-containing phosphotransfer) domain-containing protein